MAIRRTIEQASREFDALCDAAARGRTVIIERPDREDVALVSAAELRSIRKTMHLIRSPANAVRLFSALEAANRRTSSEGG